MPRKRHSPEEVIALLREADVRLSQGETVGSVCRAIGVTEQTYYRWRREYGGLKVDQAKRLKDVERENLRLRKAVADLTLDAMILKEAAKGVKAVWETPRRGASDCPSSGTWQTPRPVTGAGSRLRWSS